MANPFYTYSGSFIPGTLARAEAEAIEFTAVQAGFAALAVEGTDSGVVNAYVVTTQGAVMGAYADGNIAQFKPNATNTSTATVNVNGIGAVALKRFNGTNLQPGDLVINTWSTIVYNSTFACWTLVGPTSFVTGFSGTISPAAPPNKVGLVAVAGVATAAAPIDATYAIDQTISPTWTGNHTHSPGSGIGIKINAVAGQYAATLLGAAGIAGEIALCGNGNSAGTTSFDIGQTASGNAVLSNRANSSLNIGTNSATNIQILAAGNISVAAPSSGTALTVNAVTSTTAVSITDATAAFIVATNGASGVTIGTSSNHQLILETNASARLTIAAGGLVTMAAAASGATLSISVNTGTGVVAISANGNAATTMDLTNSSTGTSASMYTRWLNSADSTVHGITSTLSTTAFFTNGPTVEHSFLGTPSNIPLSIGTNGIERARIAAAGNVTLNAPASGTALTVNAVTSTTAVSITDATTTFIVATNGASGVTIGTSSNHQLIIETNGSTRVTVAAAGNITVSAPASGVALAVNSASGTYAATILGAAGIAGEIALCGNGNTAGTTSFDIGQTASGVAVLSNRANSTLNIGTNSVTNIQILAAGNVSVSAPTSGTALTVTGVSTGAALAVSGGNGSTLTSASGTALTVTGISGAHPLVVNGAGTTSASQSLVYEPLFGLAANEPIATYDTGSFTGTLTGMSAATTGTVNYVRVGNMVTLYITASITGTSTTTAMTMTGLPTEVTPVNSTAVACGRIENNNTVNQMGVANVLSGGTITFELLTVATSIGTTATTAFNAANTKGITAGWTITYAIQ